MKGCGKVVTLLLGIILGVVLTFGGIAFGGYLILTKEGMVGVISERIGDGMPFEFTDEAKAKSVLAYGTGIWETIAGAQDAVLADIEYAIGISGLVENISSMTGIEPEVLRAARMSNIAEDLSEAITLGGIFNAFNITPPDLPLFTREDILNAPAVHVFEDFDSFVLGDFVKIETEGENAAAPVMLKLKDIPIGELSNNMEQIIKDIKLEEMTVIITNEEAEQGKQDYLQEHGSLDGYQPLVPSSPIMQTFKKKEVLLGDLMDNMDAVLQDITMKEMTIIVTQEDIDADEQAYEAEHGSLDGYQPRALSSPFMLNLKDVTLGELMNNADGIINDMTLEELIEIDEESNAALKALRDTKIGELGGAEADATIKGIRIADLVTVTEDSSEVMKYFAENDITLDGIDDAIKRMKVKNIITVSDTSTTFIKSLQDAALDTYTDDNGTPDDPYDDFEVLGIEDTIKTLPLSGIIEVSESSSKIMQSLADARLETYTDEYGVTHKGIDDTVRTLALSQMVSIVTDEEAEQDKQAYLLEYGNLEGYVPLVPSSKFLQALKDCPLETYTDENDITHKGVDEKIQETALGDLVDVGTAHIWGYLADKTFSEMGSAIVNMALGDAILIIETEPEEPGCPPRSHAILVALKDSKINDLGTDLPDAIDDCLLADLITIDQESPAILKALADKNTKIGGLSAAVSALTIGEIYPDASTGALSLLDPSTTIETLPDAMTTALTTKTLGELEEAGIISNVNPNIKDYTIQDLVNFANIVQGGA